MFATGVPPAMTAISFIVLAGVGRLGVWLVMTNGITMSLRPKAPELIQEMLGCDLCVGFWAYLIIGLFAVPLRLFDNRLLDILTYAAVSSFLVHLITAGFTARYLTVTYE